MAAQGQPDYITRAEAQQEIVRLVQELAGAILNQQNQIEILSRDARALIDKLANDADVALKNNKAEAEKQIETQVGVIRKQTQSAVTHSTKRIFFFNMGFIYSSLGESLSGPLL